MQITEAKYEAKKIKSDCNTENNRIISNIAIKKWKNLTAQTYFSLLMYQYYLCQL